MKKFLFFLFFATSINIFSQCPTVTVAPLTMVLTCPFPSSSFTATPSYTNNITSRWLGNNNVPLTSTVITNINSYKDVFSFGAPGTYTVEFTDNSSSCVVTQTVNVTSSSSFPTFNLSASSYTQSCSNSALTFSISGATSWPTPGGPLGYTIGVISPTYSFVPLSSGSGLAVINSCGIYRVLVHDYTNNCEASYSVVVGCGTLTPSPITLSGTNSVCIGSSTTFSASGVNSYTWSTSSNSSSINVTPSVTTNYSVAGTNSVGCITNSVVAVTVNTSCAQVWPGDANSDGIVDNSDVFELGLWNLNTGAARTTTSNVYTSQFASNWTGTVSTGKNKNHADCDGNGVINAADTLAIFNNFLQTHAFKTSNTFVVNPDITIAPTQTLVGSNAFSSADIYLGDATNQINNIYGVAFNIQFDTALVQNNSVHISFINSFLNAANSNINFKKTIFASEKLYTTSVRTNGANVSGNGKIATLYFKTKANYPTNSVLNLSIVNPKKINNTGVINVLTAGTSSLQLANDVGVHEISNISTLVKIFPNPAKEILYINNSLKEAVNVELIDLLGKSLLNVTVLNSEKIDLKGLATGVYFIKVRSNTESFERKIIVE